MASKRQKLFAAVGVVVVIGTFFSLHAFQSVPLVRFRPVRMDAKQRLQVSRDPLTTDQADHVVAVLRQYGERCRRADSNTVLITPALSMDTELVWNYTSKAGL